MTRLFGSTRVGGVWGIAFVVLLLVSAAMVSLPTASSSAGAISAFYKAHSAIIVVQQVVGVVALAPFVLFALSLRPNRWLLPAIFLFAGVELVTNVLPLAMVASPDSGGSLTVVEDIADSALFAAVALFVVVATLDDPRWLRGLAVLVAVLSVIRAVASPLGMTALDFVAPLAFVAFVLLLSIRKLAGVGAARQGTAPANR